MEFQLPQELEARILKSEWGVGVHCTGIKFNSIIFCIIYSGISSKLGFEDLFAWVKDYTFEELGGHDFFETYQVRITL